MSTTEMPTVVHGVMVFSEAPPQAVEDALVAGVKAEATAVTPLSGTPAGRRLSMPDDGTIVYLLAEYQAVQPVSAAELDTAMQSAGVESYEGVSLHVSDQGVSSVEFGGGA